VGRHTTPGTGTPEPDRGFWVRLAVAAVVVVLVGGFFALRLTDDGDGTVETAGGPAASSSPATSAGSPAPASSSSSAGTPAATPTKRPPTLSFTVKYPAYITVRVPGGVTLVSRLFKKGATASYDKAVLQVVNGRPEAVRFVVNGKPRKPGPSGQTEVFTVRRR
jgi:hypothetical protein